MDTITQLIKAEIKKQYKSVRQFSEKSGIPYSTLSNALSKGIGGTSYETVVKICNLLNLKQVYDTDITVFDNQCYEICTMLTALDERAVHTLKTILSVEFERCTSNQTSGSALGVHNDFRGGSV
ncbi:MAG: helix-turn-helix transcriptional regulator [Clostridia bacterium]|nr:helix-turn-helix transcriptional regulator [Clostridia bacterium]